MKAADVGWRLQRAIDEAVKLHGHLGPFLVVGVRMAGVAERVFNQTTKGSSGLQVAAKVPLLIPFSCTIDGIQATSHCTIGNQRLRIENASDEIVASFTSENSGRTVCVSVKHGVIRELTRRMSAGIDNDRLAGEIAAMPEKQLFRIKKE